MKQVKRTLEELDIIDDYLFVELMTDKLYKEDFIRCFLKIVLGEEVKVRAVTAQSIATPGSREKRGIRMDVETEAETFLSQPLVTLEGAQKAASSKITADIEMQGSDDRTGTGEKYDLRKRSRLYQSLLDVNMLSPGMDYGELGQVLIIICTPYDLFGQDRLKYTFEYTCQEDFGLCLNDGAQRIFLNTHGHIGSEELKKLLCYIENSTEENAVNDDLKKMHEMVTAVKGVKKRRESYMWTFEREAMIRDEGKEEGIKEGIKKGIKEGTEKGTTRVNQLIRALITASRETEIERAVSDSEYQEKLFQELGI